MSAKDIRNIVLLGHGGSGKTTLAESMLFMTGGTDRFGKVTDGNTTCDYDAEEIKRNISISLAVAPVKYKNVKINVLDTPGNFDFAGEVLSGIRAAECAVLVCGAKDGLSVGAERAWKMLGNKPRMIFINRTDEENSDYNACFDALKGKFGTAVAPIVAPIIDGSKKVTGIVDLLHNKAYEVKGGKAAECRHRRRGRGPACRADGSRRRRRRGADGKILRDHGALRRGDRQGPQARRARRQRRSRALRQRHLRSRRRYADADRARSRSRRHRYARRGRAGRRRQRRRGRSR